MADSVISSLVTPGDDDRIGLRSHGGDGSAEIEALLGDKILDLLLYWRLTRRFHIKNEGQLTQLRSVYVSNQTMAMIGEKFVVPRHMNRISWESASIHEKGTAVEAIVGRSFIQHNCNNLDFNSLSMPDTTVNIGYEILDAIETCVKTRTERILSNTGNPTLDIAESDEQTLGHKNPAQALFEWLQLKLKITKPAETISFYVSSGTESGIQTETKFVGEFQLPPNMKFSSIDVRTDVKIRGDACINKKMARDSVARYVLRHFRIDSTLSFAAAVRKPPPPSQAPPPSYLMPKLDPSKQPAPYEKPASSRLYEWLQRNGVSFPAKTIEVIDVLTDDDVTRDGAFQGIFTMPNTDPPEILHGGKFANKRDAKEDVAAAALARYNVPLNPSSRKRRRRLPSPFLRSNCSQVPDDAESISDQICRKQSRSVSAPCVSSFRSCSVVSSTSSQIINTNVAVLSDKVSVNFSLLPCTDESNSVQSSCRQGDDENLANIWNTIQSRYGQPATANGRESILCSGPISKESSLAYVNQYLSRYCNDARITSDDLERLFAPQLMQDDICLPSIAGLLYFELHTPWDSSPLREWFEMSWAKKPVNALCLLRARIGAQFMFKFWRCRLNGGVQTVQDALILVAFWDGNFGPFYGIGVGMNPGIAAKAALAQLWPMVKSHVDGLISVAETKYAVAEQRAADQATKLAITEAQIC